MSNEIRVRQNFLNGVVDDNPLGSGATTLTSSSLASLVAIGSTQHLPIVLDPDASAGAPEVVYVTAHTAAATTATVLRGREGTTARSHAQNIPWRHAPTLTDFALSGTMLPAWTAATLAGSIGNYSAVDATQSWEDAAYYLGPDGVVRLRGLLYNVPASTSGTTTVLFTLPAGYRPEKVVFFYVGSNLGMVRVDVKPSGDVIYLNSGAAIPNNNTGFLSLAGIAFRQYA